MNVRRRKAGLTGADMQIGQGVAAPRALALRRRFCLATLAVLLLLLVPSPFGVSFAAPATSVSTAQRGWASELMGGTSTLVGFPPVAKPDNMPRSRSDSNPGPVEAPPPEPVGLSIHPDDDLLFVILPGIAGLAVLVVAVILTIVLKRGSGGDRQVPVVGETRRGKGSRLTAALVAPVVLAVLSVLAILALDSSAWTLIWSAVIFAVCSILIGLLLLIPRLLRHRPGEDRQRPVLEFVGDGGAGGVQTARLRYALLAISLWFALSLYLILDVAFAVSVYWWVVAIYTAFCVLIGALLLSGSPSRAKLLILGLLVVTLFSVRFVDWNSRKPFLKDLYHVQEGMTVQQVEQIMGDYTGGIGRPAQAATLPAGEVAAGESELASPDILVYRHTNEGWGNSDWGEIRFENGRVVEIRFLPD